MNTVIRRLVKCGGVSAIILAGACFFSSQAATLTIGEHAALPGSFVRIPVSLSDAAGVAAVSVVVNYDPTIVTLTNVSAGGLGQSFNMETNWEEGRVCVALVRDEALGGGAGTLFYLDCWLNPGTVPGMSSQFAIADRSLSGLHAVNFSWGGATVGQSNGVLRVVSSTQDTDANGLPDWWEETYFEQATGTNPQGDDDGDGQSNYGEFRAGTDPRNASNYLHISNVSVGPPFRVEFPTVIGKTYRVEYSGDINQWFTLASGISGTGATEQVSDGNSGNSPHRFYRIVVE